MIARASARVSRRVAQIARSESALGPAAIRAFARRLLGEMQEPSSRVVPNEPSARRVEGQMHATTSGSNEGDGEPGGRPGEIPSESPPKNEEARHAGAHTRVSAGRHAPRPENARSRLLTGVSARQSPTRRSDDELR